ncbi:thermostable carboxypeptidase 1 [Anaplasma platys]|uniref:Metal-dependent carboxypeptidase n=2 Tax=Anaplasma platys TaxID=949 RepID=A0A858PXR4_9RICK|nr:thermostable carboxypeptidase 1 [Anaplasma platys]
MKHYKFLEQIFAKVRNISDVIDGLCYGGAVDQDVTDRIRTLQEIRQEIIDSDVVASAINTSLSSKGQLSDWEVANLHCMNRMHKNQKGIPASLITSLTEARMKCRNSWMVFREGDEPSNGVMQLLGDVVQLSREVAAIKSEDLGFASRYDALLKIYDGDFDTKRIDEAFTDAGAFFRQFYGEVLEKQNSGKVRASKSISKAITCDKQRMLHECLVSAMCEGIAVADMTGGYTGCSVDWFEWAGGVSCHEEDYRIGLRGAMESVGHALYKANLPQKWKSQPIGGFAGNVMYEAQGALMSCHLLRDNRFLEFVFPTVKKLFSLRGRAADVENLQMYLSEVKTDLLLERSDEVTSLAHVMLRYALEKEMINGDLEVSELPDAWAQGMRYYFDSVPSDDREGFLQDEYWVSGVFGYLPGKVLGAVAATQIYSSMANHKVDVLSRVEKGDFSALVGWLCRYVYSNGARYSSTMMLKKITGRRIDMDAYKNHLVSRYLSM